MDDIDDFGHIIAWNGFAGRVPERFLSVDEDHRGVVLVRIAQGIFLSDPVKHLGGLRGRTARRIAFETGAHMLV